MRLIDADALIDGDQTMPYPNVPFDVLGEMVDWFVKMVDKQPTIDAVPIVHGEWEKARPKGIVSYADGYAECSNCHDTIWCGWKMNYCPNCGAKMGKEKGNADS